MWSCWLEEIWIRIGERLGGFENNRRKVKGI